MFTQPPVTQSGSKSAAIGNGFKLVGNGFGMTPVAEIREGK